MNNVFFTSDLHLGHRKMLELYMSRPFANYLDIDAHDEFLIQRWNETVDKYDFVYILGDFSLRPASETQRILQRLKGHKFLCPGNHDSSVKSLGNLFEKVQQIMEVTFKASRFPYLASDLKMVLCHYPLVDWPMMREGAVHLHGHCHGALPTQTSPFRYDVGIDATGCILTSLKSITAMIPSTPLQPQHP